MMNRTCAAAVVLVMGAFAPPAFAAEAIPSRLSFTGMFLNADWVVKLVILGLIAASLVTWTVLIAKAAELRKSAAACRAQRDALNDTASLAALPQTTEGPLLAAARTELRLSQDTLQDGDGVKERIATRFGRIEAESARDMTRGVNVLATIGATAPFVGLFGTVWGIMNSFIGIAEKQTSNLAVVAPGIAEALLATAAGLVAAIPAVVIYNHFSRQIAAHRAIMGDIAAAIMNLVSRDLSRGMSGADARSTAYTLQAAE